MEALRCLEHHVTLWLHNLERMGIIQEFCEGVFCFVSGAYIQFLLLPSGEASRALHRALAEAVSRIIDRSNQSTNADFELVFLRANLALQGGAKYRKALEFSEIASITAMNLWLLRDAVRYGEAALQFSPNLCSPQTRLSLAKAYLSVNPFVDYGKAVRVMTPLTRFGVVKILLRFFFFDKQKKRSWKRTYIRSCVYKCRFVARMTVLQIRSKMRFSGVTKCRPKPIR